MTPAIETRGLTRRFGRRTAVQDVDLSVPARSVYGFLGRNGAGKTTTLRLVLGLLRPDAGTVRVAGIDVARDRLAAARRVGALLDAPGFYPHLSGRENLELDRRLLGLARGEVDRVLAVAELVADQGRRVGDYSLGMRQRLGLARALLGAPPVLVLDEPMNGLDPEGMADMRALLRDLPARTGATVLVSSHLLAEVEQVASHIGILGRGRLHVQGELAALMRGMATEVEFGTEQPERAAGLAHAHGFTVARADGGLVARFAPGEDARGGTAALNRALCAAGLAVHAITPRQRTLETLYREASRAALAAPASR